MVLHIEPARTYDLDLKGALIARLGFRGPVYYNNSKEPQNSIGNDLGPYSKPTSSSFSLGSGARPRQEGSKGLRLYGLGSRRALEFL